jgi:hypothetical protein
MSSKLNELVAKIESQIDQVVFIHENPRQVSELRGALLPLPRPSHRMLESCIKKMEEINGFIAQSTGAATEPLPIRRQLEFLYNARKHSFDDCKCYTSLVKNRRVSILFPNRKAAVKNSRRTITYEFREKLIGFLPKQGSLKWSDEKIDNFIKSLMS